MPTSRHIQTSLSAGEFDPLLWSREDVSFFYNSARLIENVVPLPQGGGKRREGWRFSALQRGPVEGIDLSGATPTATNGGTAANGIDGSDATAMTTTTGISTSATYEVFRVDLGSATKVSLVDFTGLRIIDLPSGLNSGEFQLQHSDDGSTWTTAATMNVGNVAYNRRFGAKPDTALATDRYWRLLLNNPDTDDFDTATVEFLDMAMHAETGWSDDGTVGSASLHRLTATIENEFVMIATAGNIDIFERATGEWQAAVAIPHDDDQVGTVKNAPYLDTIFLYHEDQPPHLVQRLGANTDWRSGEIEFTSVPDFPFTDGDVSGGENEIQHLRFSGMSSGDGVVIEYNGDISAEISWTGTPATNAAALESAIEGLADITSVTITQDGGSGANANFLVEFDGVDEKQSWAVLIIDILTGSGTVELKRKQYGKPDTAPLWGGDRGYPRCGTFYQGRHWMGGFRDRPDVLVGSRAGALLDFKEDADPVVSSPIVVAPNIDDQVTIQNIYPGRHLQIFTSSAELYVPEEPITIDNIALKVTSRYGSSDYTQPVDVQGGTLFSDRNGRALREYLFTDAEASYTAEPVSLLAGHLMSSPRSLVMRRALDIDEPTLLLLANTGLDRDGNRVPAAMVVIDRAQQVTGFCRIKTQGTPLNFATTQNGDAFALVRRELNGQPWNYLEKFDADYMSDASVKIENDDYDEATATADQTVFSYTFTSPTSEADVAVWTRASSSDDWSRVGGADYEVDLGAKEVTFAEGLAAGTLVRVNLRQSTADLSAVAPFLDGVEVATHTDGISSGTVTVSGDTVDIGDERFDFSLEVGLRQVPRIILHPYKGRGQTSPTMKKQRIFRALLQLERTASVAITAHDGGTPRSISLRNYDSGMMDRVLSEILFTGAKRVSGLGSWQTEPRIEITQKEPMPFLLRSITYDVRF